MFKDLFEKIQLLDIPRGSLVIVEGQAPIWRYGMALHLLHGSPAARRCLLRSAPGCRGGGDSQPGVAGGPGGGCRCNLGAGKEG